MTASERTPIGYPSFTGDDAACPKCGCVEVSMRYRRPGTYFPGPGHDGYLCNDGPQGAQWPEWMHRECEKCGYDWAEQCP